METRVENLVTFDVKTHLFPQSLFSNGSKMKNFINIQNQNTLSQYYFYCLLLCENKHLSQKAKDISVFSCVKKGNHTLH